MLELCHPDGNPRGRSCAATVESRPSQSLRAPGPLRGKVVHLVVIRRLVASSLIILMGLSAAESAAGTLRDGDVHHETPGAAANHASQGLGDHGHEDGGSEDHEHGQDHEHGTSLDHCTHVHGPGVVASFAFEVSFVVTAIDFAGQLLTPRVTTRTLTHPPRV